MPYLLTGVVIFFIESAKAKYDTKHGSADDRVDAICSSMSEVLPILVLGFIGVLAYTKFVWAIYGDRPR